MKLTPPMTRALQLARELGEIHRHPPGIWGTEAEGVGPAINASTVVALVTRGLLYYSLWKQTESGSMFPIAARPRASVTIDDADSPSGNPETSDYPVLGLPF